MSWSRCTCQHRGSSLLVELVEIVEIVDIVGIIDTVDIFSNLEQCYALIEAISKTLLNDLISIMGLRDASTSKNARLFHKRFLQSTFHKQPFHQPWKP